MRRLVLSFIAACGLVTVFPGSASAGPTAPAADAAPPVAGKKVCRATDPKLAELSGLVATGGGFVAVNDGSLNQRGMRIFFLDTACRVVKQVSYSGDGPRDPEDLVLSKDGKTLWIADTGDKNKDRKTIGLWKLPADGSKSPVLYRLSYPQGDGPYDAEALLLSGDGTPIIVTKALTKALVFVPTAELKANRITGVPMRRAGEIVVPPSTTPTGLPYGRGVITGGAVAPGGDRVALRTYSDALEWEVTGGDVVAALKGRPRVTPLPNERQGEAITYTTDGKAFLTVNNMQGVVDPDVPNDILRYTPAAATSSLVAAGASGAKSDAAADTRAWFDKLSLTDITYLVGAVGVLGALLVGAGIVGIVRARRRPPLPDRKAPSSAAAELPDPLDAETELLEAPDRGPGRPVGVGVGPRSAVYGGGRPASGPGANGRPAPGVYGAPAAPAVAKGSGVYGGVAAGGQSGNGRPGKGSVYGAQSARPQGAAPGRPPTGAPGRPAGGASSRPSQAPSGQGVPQGAPQGRPQGPPAGRPPQGAGSYGSGPMTARPQGAGSARPQGGSAGRQPGGVQAPPPGRPAGAPGRQPGPAQGRATGAAPQVSPPQRSVGQGQGPGLPPARPAPKARPAGAASGRPSGFFGQDSGRRDAGRGGPGQPTAGRRPDQDAPVRGQAGRGQPGQGQPGQGRPGQRQAGPSGSGAQGQRKTGPQGQSPAARPDPERRPAGYVPRNGDNPGYGGPGARGDR